MTLSSYNSEHITELIGSVDGKIIATKVREWISGQWGNSGHGISQPSSII